MNKVFKVIWSEARNAYVVVSEIAKNHGSKSCSTKKLLTMLIATGVMTCASMAPAMAAPNVDASATVNVGKKAAVDVAENAKVNVEEGSNVSVDKNVTIGKGAVSSPYVGQTGNVAIGEKALAWNGNGLQEALMDFGQGGAKVKSFFGIPYGADIVDGTKLPGSIAIGKNTVARSGSTMIGDHGYTGKIGDTTITPDGNGIMKYNNDVYSTTIGANSFNSGALASVTGVFSIASSKYDGENYKFHAVQNTGATIYGSMNSIESATSDAKYSGIASSVLGFANKTQNANAALIWGTGNEVTNSIESIDIDYNGWNKLSVAEAQQKAIEAMQSSKYAGGSVMAIGGGNKADYAKYSQLTGVQNKVTGTEAKTAKYDFVNGYQNTVTNASDVTVIGIKNEVTADGNKVIGDNHKVSGRDNVIFGSADKVTETTVNNAVVLGHNAKVTGEGAVALGSGSVADRANAVSVGRKDANRQIINVAAGTEDTDAVNVSQLRDATANANKGWKLSTEGGAANQVASEATVDFSGKKDAGDHQNITVSNDGNNVKIDLASELHNVTGVVNGDSRVALGTGVAGITNGQASVVMLNGSTQINGVVGIDNTGKISGVANGEADKDAVNYGQLKDVKAEAEKHSVVTDGANITVTPEKATDGHMQYKVALKNDITLEEDDPDAFVSISGSKGTIWTSGSVTAGSVAVGTAKADGTTPFFVDSNGAFYAADGKFSVDKDGNANANSIQTNALNSKYNLSVGTANVNGTMPFFVNSNGAFYAANGKLVVDKDGKVTATEGEIGNVVLKNGVLYKNTALRDGELYVGDASGNYSQITTKGAKLGKVTVAADGKISGVAAGAVTADSTDAVNGSQLHAVATEAGKHSKVVNGNNTNVEETTVDGQKVYKVNLNNNIMVGDVTGKYVSISGTNGTIEATGAIATKDRVYADKGAKLADIDVTGDTISNGDAKMALNGAAGIAGMINGKGASVYMQDGYTVINSKVAFDQNGKISGVAAGAVTADSTDAVNGSQLHAVATEAGKHTTLSNGKNTTVTSTNKDGQVDYQVNVAGDLKDITSVSNGDSKINLNADSISISNGNKSFAITNSGIGMSYITADYSTKSIMLGENGTTISGGLNVAGSKITGVAAGVADTDAVNVGQLKEAVEAGNTDTHIKPGEYGVGADNTVKMDVVDKNGNKVDTVTIKDVAKASDVGDVNNIANDIKNKEGKTTVVDAVNNLNNKVGDLQYSKVEKGDIADGDSTTTAIGKLDQKLTDVAATAAKHTKVEGSSNIIVTNTAKEGEAANYQVKLNETIDVNTVTANSVTTGQTVMNNDGLKVGKDVSVTATAVTAGKTSISDEGVKVGDKTYISDKGLNANGQNITNVADGKVEKDSKDAINGGQLHQAKADINNRIDGVENQVVSNTNRINQLGSRVNKVGAGAAALAALHPMDFDPDDKLTFSAGYGNYGGENAAAIGAYYRPDEKVMFSVGGTVGNGENMVNAGVSFSLDRTNHVSNSRTAMAREILDLRAEVTELKAMVAKGGLGSIAEDKMKIFPDVAENHWAYEYVGKLAAAGIIEGYPDGNFSGDRMMSRYEFAAMLYRAMQKGAQLDSKIINEFAPEMGRIRVDRISGEDGDRDKIERVRVNAVKGERDHYGNKIAKAEAKAK